MVGLAILAILARNQIAHALIEHVGSSLLGKSVTVRQVQIGFRTVEIKGIEVEDASLTKPKQVVIRSITIAPTIWRGLCDGIWLQNAIIDEPTVHLHFDREGRLLSRLPESGGNNSGPIGRLPFERASLLNGSVVVHQEGKQALTLGGASLKTTTVDGCLRVHAEVTDLLGTNLQVECSADTATYGGVAKLTLAPLHLDARQMARLPFLPTALVRHLTRGAVEAQLEIRHPASNLDFRKLEINFRSRVSATVDAEYGLLTTAMDLRGSMQNGIASVDVKGPLANGLLELHAHLNVEDEVPTLTATYQLAGVDLEPVALMLAPGNAISATASMQGNARAAWENQGLKFRATLVPVLSDLQADGIPVCDITTNLICDGLFVPGDHQPLTGSLRMDTASSGVNLEHLTHRLGMSDGQGHLGFQGVASVPLETLTDLETYTADVSCRSSLLACDGIAIHPLSLAARLEQGTVNLTLPQAVLTVRTAADRPPGCAVSQLQIAETLQIHAAFESSAPVLRLLKPEAWTVSAKCDLRGIAVAQESISDFNTTLTMSEGRLGLSPCEIRWRETTCVVTGAGDLGDKARMTVHFDAEPVPLQVVASLASRYSGQPLPLSGTARASGNLTLDLGQTSLTADGDLTLANSQYGQTRLGDAALQWEIDRNGARLRSSSHDFFGGSYVIDATLQSPDWTRTTLAARAQNIQLPRLAAVGGISIDIGGVIDGSFRLGSIGDLTSLKADGLLTTRGATIGGMPVEFQTTQFSAVNGLATAAVRGVGLNGSLALDASSQLSDLTRWLQHESRSIEDLPVFGRLKVTDISVKRLLTALGQQPSLSPLSSSVSLTGVRDLTTVDQGVLATFVGSAERIRWGQSLMSRRLRATCDLLPTQLNVNSIDGNFADGSLSGDAALRFGRTPTGSFRIHAKRVNLRRALGPLPDVSRSVNGTVSVSISGRLGTLTSGVAKVHASNITLADLSIREIALPIEYAFQSQSARMKWNCRRGTIRLGGGSVTLSSEGSLRNGLATLNAGANVRSVDSAKLLRSKSLSAGVIDGYVNVRAKRARTAADLSGRYQLTLSQIQSIKLPGSESFTQLVKLPTFSPPTASQQDGATLEGRVVGGLLHLDNFTLSKSGLLVLMDGTSTLDGRLNFDVSAFTNQSGPADGLLALADSPLMLAVSAPVAVLAKANEAMKDRVVHLHVGGTSVRPTFRLQPAKNLSQDALRFFLASAVGNPVANMATNKQRQSIR